jgi:hypothetical protein
MLINNVSIMSLVFSDNYDTEVKSTLVRDSK